MVFFGWAGDSTGVDFKFQVQIDDTTTVAQYNHAPNETYSNGHWTPGMYIGQVTLTAASHAIDLDYGLLDSGKTVYISGASINIERVN
jgi:hypothetical protein